MPFFRLDTVRRLIASVAVLCLVGMTIVPSFAHRANYTSYGDWLRAQVRGGVDETFDRALARALADRAPSLEHFLHAFVASWNEEGEPSELSAVFGVDGLEGSLLVSYLQSRFSGLTPDALPVRTIITVPSSSLTMTSGRFGIEARESSPVSYADLISPVELLWLASGSESESGLLLTSMPRLGP
jgi:hypothetical protein